MLCLATAQYKTPERSVKRRRPESPLTPFVDSMKPDEAKSIHAVLADFIFSAGLPFSIVEHPKFKLLAKRLRPMYDPPTRKTIVNKYLDAQYKTLKTTFSNKLAQKPLRFTLVTDGWTNTRQESIINYVLVDPIGKAYFHSSNATGAAAHNAEFLSSELIQIHQGRWSGAHQCDLHQYGIQYACRCETGSGRVRAHLPHQMCIP